MTVGKVADKPAHLVKRALELAKDGEAQRAYNLLRRVVRAEPDNHRAWLALASVSTDLDERRVALQHVLRLRRGAPKILRLLHAHATPAHVQYAAKRGVFINYARADELTAFQIACDLREFGLRVWMDEINVPRDADWHTSINTALKRCGVMVTLLSFSSVHDKSLCAERQQFVRDGKLVIPVLLHPCEYNRLDLWFRPVDMRGAYRDGFAALLPLLDDSTKKM